ncbi:hypothetical protein [Psychrobacter sp. I-STPA10]|uniref:hypothetical protein n=1 Tax=Psychrobacter sp. I-STPA10 TaxID=2585769 RepID=UPI001E2DF837|nr:hypothetical protein [Psychrobacter sp. I-STPA10]
MLNIYDYEPFHVYSSYDDDAPQLDKSDFSFSTVLKACLITGYGDKQPPQDWTMPVDDIENTGTRAFSSTAILSSHCIFTVTHDTSDKFVMTATAADADTAFATTTRSKKMFNFKSETQDWFVIANNQSCYVLLQTDVGTPLFAVFFFGSAYTTEAIKQRPVLWGGDYRYEAVNYSINRMQLTDEHNQKWYKKQIFDDDINAGTQHVFCAPIFKSDMYGIFLPGLVEHAGQLNTNNHYLKIADTASDILMFKTAWAQLQNFGVVLKGSYT